MDHAVRPFDLTIGSRMGNGDVFDGDASVFAEVPKMMASKRSSKVGDNVVRETESVDDIFEELDCFLCSGQTQAVCIRSTWRTCQWQRTRTGNHLALV